MFGGLLPASGTVSCPVLPPPPRYSQSPGLDLVLVVPSSKSPHRSLELPKPDYITALQELTVGWDRARVCQGQTLGHQSKSESRQCQSLQGSRQGGQANEAVDVGQDRTRSSDPKLSLCVLPQDQPRQMQVSSNVALPLPPGH